MARLTPDCDSPSISPARENAPDSTTADITPMPLSNRPSKFIPSPHLSHARTDKNALSAS
jgi:hypothetical protein